MTMYALNGVLSDIYIVQIIIQNELEMLIEILQQNVILKDIKFLVKVRDIHKNEKKDCTNISVFLVMKTRRNIQSMSKNAFIRHVHLLLIGEESKRHFVLIKDFTLKITYYTTTEHTCDVIVYRLLVQ